MSNQDLIKLLRNMAAALLIKGANRFRVIAYEKAADSIEQLTSEVQDIWREGKLDTISGIGPSLAGHLDELFKTGRVKHFEATFKDLSPALFEFMLIPGLGPKRAHQLTEVFKLTDPKTAVDELVNLARKGKVAELEGWGEESQAKLLSGIETYKRGQIKENRMPLPYANALAEELIDLIRQVPGVKRVDVLGSLRRRVSTIGDIDLAAATTKPEKAVEAFVKNPKVSQIIDQGPKGATVLLGVGRQADLRVQSPEAYGAMLQYFTGSKNHNIKLRELALKQGLSLNEHGIKQVKSGKTQTYATEEEFYNTIKLDWVPPEIREDKGEIEAASQHALPKLVSPTDIKGDLHIHSDYDLKSSHDLGSSSLQELLEMATSLNYEYIGISDHNPKTKDLSENQIVEIMKHRRETFEQIFTSWKPREKKRTQIFTMLEVDIDPKGKLALPERAFEYVDAVIVSLHSSFNQSKGDMTKRILRALAHPKAKIFGHPTGRLLGSREGVDANWPEIFGYCKENNKALEINSWPERLDLPDLLVRDAINMGVKLIIDTDSHAASHMQGLPYGVSVARRGWAEPKDILNTLGYNEFKTWLKS